MRKLKLDLDHLAVESFETNAADGAQRGTVRGFNPTCENSCLDTCYYTCGGSCAGTCTEPTCITCHTYCEQESAVNACP
ncbi:MAG TPA: pinensin family lanthipeptide [Longimicrobium sp.]|nr:pinensin family lanthipeptide [Longimicrobium sp.]